MEWKKSPLNHRNLKREFVSYHPHADEGDRRSFLADLVKDSQATFSRSSLFDDDADHEKPSAAVTERVEAKDPIVQLPVNSVKDSREGMITKVNTASEGMITTANTDTKENVKVVDLSSQSDELQQYGEYLSEVEKEFPQERSISVASSFLAVDDMVALVARRVRNMTTFFIHIT